MSTGKVRSDAWGISIRIAIAWNSRGAYAHGDVHEIEALVGKLEHHDNVRTTILDVQLPPIETRIFGVVVPPDGAEDGVELEVNVGGAGTKEARALAPTERRPPTLTDFKRRDGGGG